MGDILCGDIKVNGRKDENLPKFNTNWLASLKT